MTPARGQENNQDCSETFRECAKLIEQADKAIFSLTKERDMYADVNKGLETELNNAYKELEKHKSWQQSPVVLFLLGTITGIAVHGFMFGK